MPYPQLTAAKQQLSMQREQFEMDMTDLREEKTLLTSQLREASSALAKACMRSCVHGWGGGSPHLV